MLVRDADEAESPLMSPDGVVCRIRLLDTGRMDASTVESDGTASEIVDFCLEDLMKVLERAEALTE